MLKRKKLAKIRRDREAEQRAEADAKAKRILDKKIRERKERLKKWREERKDFFWMGYHESLREDERVGQGDGPLTAAPCTKKRSVLDPY